MTILSELKAYRDVPFQSVSSPVRVVRDYVSAGSSLGGGRMSINLDLAGRCYDVESVVLENDWFRASVLPSVGAKIHDLLWKPTGRNILWHKPRILPQAFPVDGNSDDHWCGGWDEGFPTYDPCEYRGEQYPALGELRSVKWHVQATGEDGEKAFVKLFAFGPTSPVRAKKTVTLMTSSPVLRVH